MEDRLHRNVLHAIAVGEISGGEAIMCAAAALASNDVVYERWYA